MFNAAVGILACIFMFKITRKSHRDIFKEVKGLFNSYSDKVEFLQTENKWLNERVSDIDQKVQHLETMMHELDK